MDELSRRRRSGALRRQPAGILAEARGRRFWKTQSIRLAQSKTQTPRGRGAKLVCGGALGNAETQLWRHDGWEGARARRWGVIDNPGMRQGCVELQTEAVSDRF